MRLLFKRVLYSRASYNSENTVVNKYGVNQGLKKKVVDIDRAPFGYTWISTLKRVEVIVVEQYIAKSNMPIC